MKSYELTVMIHPDLEMNISPATDKVQKLIEDSGGTIIKETNEGKKRLAYKVSGQEFAVYYYYEVELPPEAPAKISNVLNITDEVIRYLLVAADPRKAKIEAKRAAQKDDEETNEENNNEEAEASAEEE